jgi:hypothetical protein
VAGGAVVYRVCGDGRRKLFLKIELAAMAQIKSNQNP